MGGYPVGPMFGRNPATILLDDPYPPPLPVRYEPRSFKARTLVGTVLSTARLGQ